MPPGPLDIIWPPEIETMNMLPIEHVLIWSLGIAWALFLVCFFIAAL